MPGKGKRVYLLYDRRRFYTPPFSAPESEGQMSVMITDMHLEPLVLAIKHNGNIYIRLTNVGKKFQEHPYYSTGGRSILTTVAMRILAGDDLSEPYRQALYMNGAQDKAIDKSPIKRYEGYYREGMFH
jgi:hypothetical protein